MSIVRVSYVGFNAMRRMMSPTQKAVRYPCQSTCISKVSFHRCDACCRVREKRNRVRKVIARHAFRSPEAERLRDKIGSSTALFCGETCL